MCNREPISLALVDLNATRCHPEEFLAGAKSLNIPVIAFVSHVDADLIARARQIGCGQILARSAFFNNLPQVIKSFVATDLKPVD